MASPTQLLAMHGFACPIPADWYLAVNKGDWRGGYLVLSEDHLPRLNLTWDRKPRTPDFRRSLASLARRMRKDHSAEIERVDELTSGGLLARFAGSDGLRHVAFLRPDPDLAYTLVLRQLLPGSGDELRAIADGCRVHGRDDPTVPWVFYGLRLSLHGFWQLTGVHNLVGLTRALWFNRPDPGKRPAALLVLRRYACASRVLGGRSLGDWVAEHLHRKEQLLDATEDASGLYSAIARGRGTLWQRMRRIPDQRHLHAWVEADNDRLVLQEFKGFSDPLPPLRDSGPTVT